MTEEKREEAEQSNDGEEIPSDIMPLFFTSKTQEIFACKGDEDVTEENPFKLISKEAIEQDFKSRAAISDFHPAKKIIQEYPADEVLVVYDPGFKYGQNYYLCLTEEAKERHLNPPVAEEEGAEGEGAGAGEEEVFQRKKFPRTPQPWESLGSEIEVEDEIIVENRTKMKFRISRIRREFGAPVSFTTRSATDTKDGIIECPSYEEETPSFLKKEIDKGTQAIPELIDTGNQTEWRKPRNATTQYTPREFDEKEKEEMNKSDSLKQFVEKVTPRFELALQQNEIMDVFYDDYLAMNDDETTFGAKSDSYLKEYQSFTDLQFSKEKTITHIEWHPTIKGIIAVSCGERLTFDDRVDQFSRILMTPSLVLIWSFSDPIHPLILLEAPDDIYSFKFNPSDPNIIAGGCINGQVVMWDISSYSERLKSHRQSHGQSKMNSMNSLPGFEDDSLKDQSPMIRYCAVSSIEHTHKMAVSDIQWIPDHMEIGRMGVVVENRSQHCSQLMTCAADGTVLFWDTRPTKSAAPAQSTTTNPAGIPLTFKHLDLSWKPILKVTVQRITGNGEFGPTFFSITEKQGSRVTGNKSEKEPADQTGMTRHSSSLGKSKDQGKPLENVSTKFFVGTEEGDMVYLDWKPEKDTDSGKILTPRPEFVWQAHDGPVNTLTRSPFFRDIILTVGGWTFAIWKEGVTSDPLLQSASHILRLTKGHWSPSRPGVFFITKTDGSVDVWDLLDRSHEPSLTQNVTASPITTIYPHQVSGKQQLLAVGDTMGTLHVMEVPWNLRHPSTNEANVMENFFEREVKRLAFVEERKKIREAEKKEHDAQESRKQQDAKKQEETEADVEAKQRMEYQEYLEMERKLLEELGIIEEPDEPLET